MPRRSPYQIVLSAAEKRRLERISRRYTAPYYQVVRAKVVLLAAQGLDNKSIGLKLDIPRQVASRWRNRFFDQRLLGLQDRARPGRPSVFPSDVVVRIKALACELPRESGLPLSRYSTSRNRLRGCSQGHRRRDQRRHHLEVARSRGHPSLAVPELDLPRDPRFEEKAGPVLDLYQGLWHREPLHADDMVICADEKPSIQARQRMHVPRGPRPRQAMRAEYEYERRGALTRRMGEHLRRRRWPTLR